MYLIFDFDGTLIDSFSCVIQKFNLLADEFNFRKVNLSEVDHLRNLSSRELIKYLEIPIYKIPTVLHKARKSLQNEIHNLSSFVGMAAVLSELTNAGFVLGILTSNSKDNVIAWLNHHEIRQYFNFIHAESSFFGKKKILKKILKLNKIAKDQAFYIGDETRDIEAAKQCDISSIAVTWGFSSEYILSQHHPHYIARTPQEILKIVNLFRARFNS